MAKIKKMINFEDGLWREMAEFARQTDDSVSRMLREASRDYLKKMRGMRR